MLVTDTLDLLRVHQLKDLSLCVQVHLKAPMILNGVCVIWRGWIDLQRLDGMGYLEYDDERAQVTRDDILIHFYMCTNRQKALQPPFPLSFSFPLEITFVFSVLFTGNK